MLARIAALFSLSVLFMAGTIFVADRVSVLQAPAQVVAPVPASDTPAQSFAQAMPVADDPAAGTPATDNPTSPTEPTPDLAPAQAVPTPDSAVLPPPAIQPSEPAPVVSTPPAPDAAPAPVVSAPPHVTPETPLPVARPPQKGPKAAAKFLFASKELPSLGKAMAIGYYPRGCLQGGVALPVNGPTWQVMRISRNRNWGHPSLVRFLERFAPAAAKATGWKGILVGDMAQPRGGPLPFGHTSHQIGLDVDIWFMPMPDHTLSAEEREKTAATNLVADDWKNINRQTWTPQHAAFIRTAAEQPDVERVLVNAAIKKELCRMSPGASWLQKVRPWYWHHDHIHVRLRCPADSPNCRAQPEPPAGDGCSNAELAHWFSEKVLAPTRKPPTPKPRPITMADLPPACQSVLDAPPARSAKN